MKISSRWIKILNDIWGNKSRSLLVILSIAVGVGIVGIINNARYMIERDLYGQFKNGDPADVQLFISPFPKELAADIASMRAIDEAQARRTFSTSLILPDGTDETINLNVLPDYDQIKINRPELEAGKLAPGLREITIERQAAKSLELEIGDEMLIEIDDQLHYTLVVSGIVHDLYELPYAITNEVMGYVSMSTLEWMGQRPYYNRVDLVINGNDITREMALEIGMDARDRIVEPEYVVGSIQIPGIGADPGEHWAQNQITGFVLILQIMSVMSIFLSGGLVVNTISAIIMQQVKQIGIMRSVGAVRPQITAMYIFNVLVFSLIGLLIAIPIGLAGSIGLSQFAAGFLNFDVTTVGYIPSVLILMIIIAMVIPIAVALYPILAGVSISVYKAIYQFGQIQDGGSRWVENLLFKFKRLPPQMMMSLQNTFRNMPRLTFTLITLTLAGATFVAAFSTRASLAAQVNELVRYVHYDAAIGLPYGTNRHTAEREAMRVPGVIYAESWANARGVTIKADGSEGEEVGLVGLPFDSKTLEPNMLKGRWLTENDTWQVVINDDLAELVPGTAVGSELRVEINGITRTYEVVGIMPRQISGPRLYATYPMFTKITNRHNQADQVRVRTSMDGIASADVQDRVAELLEERFSNAGLSESNSSVRHRIFHFFSEPFEIILVVLVIMAGLLAVVGSLSLTGTMGINVMERTREIGVLRAVGATNQAVRMVVVVEGVFIAIVSWILVAILSVPSSAALAGAVINAVLETELVFRFSLPGLFYWLAVVIVIGIGSSLAPAQNAVALTVREVLDYE